MAQEFWDENKQQELEKKLLELRKKIYLDWAKQVADRFVELDLPERKQLIKKITDLLEKNNIDFEVDGYEIKIKGKVDDVKFAGFVGGPEWVEIVQGNKRIIWETYMDYSILYIRPLGVSKDLGEIKLPRDLPRVSYCNGYLCLFF
jgi:hypothetical protein